MILTKLQEALSEVSAQRSALDEVEAQLKVMIARMSGAIVPVDGRPTHDAPVILQPRVRERDKIDDIADILRAEGKPLHITLIAERLSARSGSVVVRTKIEPGLNRHIAKVKDRRVDKFGPSTYGLPEWKPQPINSQAEAT